MDITRKLRTYICNYTQIKEPNYSFLIHMYKQNMKAFFGHLSWHRYIYIIILNIINSHIDVNFSNVQIIRNFKINILYIKFKVTKMKEF